MCVLLRCSLSYMLRCSGNNSWNDSRKTTAIPAIDQNDIVFEQSKNWTEC